jgi:hypothetical protein
MVVEYTGRIVPLTVYAFRYRGNGRRFGTAPIAIDPTRIAA